MGRERGTFGSLTTHVSDKHEYGGPDPELASKLISEPAKRWLGRFYDWLTPVIFLLALLYLLSNA